MLTKLIICAICALIIGLIIGGRFGYSVLTRHPDGYIVLDKNEEGTDRISFQLGMEYDDISKYEHIVFNVVRR